jgi:hypothetical protein
MTLFLMRWAIFPAGIIKKGSPSTDKKLVNSIRFQIASLLLGLVLLGPAWAQDPTPAPGSSACEVGYSRLFRAVGLGSNREERQRILDAAEQLKFSEVFPERSTVRQLGKPETSVVKVDVKSLAAFRKAFDEVWNARVALGIFPSSELKTYRNWLKTKYGGQAYPPILPEEFLVASGEGHTLASYFDKHFLVDYIPYTYGSIADYVATLDLSARAKVMGVLGRTLSRMGLFASGVVVTALLTVPGEITGPIISPVVGWLREKTRDTTQSVVDQLRLEVNKVFDGGNEAFIEALLNMSQVISKIKMDSFNVPGSSARDDKVKLDDYRKEAAGLLHRFRPLVLIVEKDFDKTSREALQLLSRNLLSVHTNLAQHRIAVDEIKARAESRGGMLTAGELELVARYTAEMEDSEEVLARGLAQYLFYMDTMDPKNQLPAEVNQNLGMILRSFERNMNLDKLRKYYGDQLESHYKTIEKLK